MNRNARLLTLVALGLAGAAASTAQAQTLIQISGATLLRNFLESGASTQDFLDVDGDGVFRANPNIPNQLDQLAPGGFPLPGSPQLGADAQYWVINYRSAGSIRGLGELISFGDVFVTNPADLPTGISAATIDRVVYLTNGACSGAQPSLFNPNNPGSSPVRADTVTLNATYVFPGSSCPNAGAPAAPGGIRPDIAPIDVPASWAVTGSSGTTDFNDQPSQPGYGRNARNSVNKQGAASGANLTNQLVGIGARNLFDPNNPGSANANTLFDTPLAFAPIAVVTNLGTGMQQIKQSELQFAFATGRLPTGENLTFVTRDSGSGTRNAFNNTTCLDPSWGVGENIGGLSALAAEHQAGAGFIPSNKAGNPEVETTVQNTRLGIGYAGAERGVNSPSWLTGGRLELLAVQHDLSGGPAAVPVRPTIGNLLDNAPTTGYLVGGPFSFVTLGDPRAEPATASARPGGGVRTIGGDNNGNPRMRNQEAAAYMNNITRSLAAFINDPGLAANQLTPGQFLARNFILITGQDYVHNGLVPCQIDVNTGLNQSLQNFIRDPFRTNPSVYNNPAYVSFGTVTRNGNNPQRATGVTYTDGVANGASYRNQAGATVNYNAGLDTRNRISGDFNGDGLRDINDAQEMIKAARQRSGGPAWSAPAYTGPNAAGNTAGSFAVIEILGDFNADGNFDSRDIRYWADGLAIDPVCGRLNRRSGFTAVDLNWGNLTGNFNYFSTTKATGAPYQAGDSSADIAGAFGGATTPGWEPIGADGAVNDRDINYVYRQFKQNVRVVDGAANWNNLSEASTSDLSADVNGDFAIDQSDACVLVFDILGTTFGDVNLDGAANGADLIIINTNIGQPGGWAQGDVDGDGVVSANDLALAQNGGVQLCCLAQVLSKIDYNADTIIDFNDYLEFLNRFNANDVTADLNGDCVVDFNDYLEFLNLYNRVC